MVRMSPAMRLPPSITITEFEAWQPEDASHDRRWPLIDGGPICMAPPGDDHGSIQSMVCYLVTRHLTEAGSPCRVVTTPGVIPRADALHNERVPDLGITCTPATGGRTIPDPVVLIELLSPGSQVATRRNVWAYTTIPSVSEILLLSSLSMSGELLRHNPDGGWPATPLLPGAESVVRLDAIGFETPIHRCYATSSLAARGTT